MALPCDVIEAPGIPRETSASFIETDAPDHANRSKRQHLRSNALSLYALQAGVIDRKRPGTPMRDTAKNSTPKPDTRTRGAQKGNSNATRHGLRAGQLPREAKYIEHRMNDFRRQLEAAVIDSKGQVTLQDAAFVQTAMRWERHAALAQRWLTKAHDTLTPEQCLHFSREIARASAERDKAIAALSLDSTEHRLPWLSAPSSTPEAEQ
jgi:hypothetical protein